MKTGDKKLKKSQRIAQLETRLAEALGGQAYVYHFADQAIGKASTERLFGSGVMLRLSFLGGREVFEPVLILDGLSPETIEALRADFRRSYQRAVEVKPSGL